MKKIALIILCFLLILPVTYAWNWKGHQHLAERDYYSFPIELQEKLNISLIREGSIAPDKDFHDTRLHHYPPSYSLALKWFNRSRESFYNKNYDDASYSFGVMTHYISDSFVAPHYIKKEDYKLHSKFEDQASSFIPDVECHRNNYDLNKSLFKGSSNIDDWGQWLVSKDIQIPQKEFREAQDLLYDVSLDLFNTTCIKMAKIEMVDYKPSTALAIQSFIIFLLILLLFVNIFKD